MKATPVPSRRAAFLALGAVSAGAVALSACADRDEDEEVGVSATEDLMREHGVLRRLLIVYRETAGLLRTSQARLDFDALGQASDLFRRFGEDYHEKELEEAHVFPAVLKAGGPVAPLVSVLIAQHARGRQINAYVAERAKAGSLGSGGPQSLAAALDGFARMYEAHAAIEDTAVFQAWKKTMSTDQLRETGELFEAIEHKQFNGDDFDLAVDEVARIERRLGLGDLSRFTAPPPPGT